MKQDQKRIESLDFIRMLAIFGAVFCHSIERIYSLNTDFMGNVSVVSRLFCFIVFTFGRIGVPLFLMLSGYLLLDRFYDSDSCKAFWKKHLLHLLICTWLWFAIYEVYLMIGHRELTGFVQILEDFLFIHNVYMNHVWYLPMIIGLYLLIPFVGKALYSMDTKLVLLPAIVFSIYAYGVPTLKLMNDVVNPNLPISNQIGIGFSGGAYGLFLIWGYLLKKDVLKKYNTWILRIVGIIAFAGGVWIQIWLYSNNIGYNIWYDNIFILIAAVTLFEVASRHKTIAGYPVVKGIAYYSFPIYLIHKMVEGVSIGYIQNLSCRMPVKVLLLFGISVAGSLVLAWIINKIPKVGKYLLYTK